MIAQPTAIIIGAGLGGIAAAARLAQRGYSVTVLEKNATPGGRCGQLICSGHRFDTGPTLFLMPEIFAETYSALGERMQDHPLAGATMRPTANGPAPHELPVGLTTLHTREHRAPDCRV